MTLQPVPARLRAGQYTGPRRKAWRLIIHADASLSCTWPCDQAVDTLNILRLYPGLMEEIMLLAI